MRHLRVILAAALLVTCPGTSDTADTDSPVNDSLGKTLSYCPASVPCQECRINEQWHDVKPILPLTCENIGKTPIPTSGCDCKTGYHRVTPKSECIPTTDCLIQMCLNMGKVNEIYKPCGQAAYCEPTCGEAEDAVCTKQYFVCPSGCQCLPGFKRNPWTRECIPSQNCPNPCKGPNEKLLNCGTTCRDDCPIENTSCALNCNRGCYCIDKHKRVDGICQDERKCKKTVYG